MLKVKFGLYVSSFLFLGMLFGVCLSAIYHVHESNNIRHSYQAILNNMVKVKDKEIDKLEEITDDVQNQNAKLIDALHLRLNKQEMKELLNDIN